MQKYNVKLMVVMMFAAFLVMPVSGYAFLNFFDQPESIKANNGEIQIPLKSVSDGKAHHFVYKTDTTDITFFVVQSQDGVVRAAFNACDVCFPEKKGYTQKGDFMICNNCGRKFHISRVNVVEGGCNPAPLKRKIEGDNLVILVADVLPGKRFF